MKVNSKLLLLALMIFSVIAVSGCTKKVESGESEDTSETAMTQEDSQASEMASNAESTENAPTESVGPAVEPEAFMGYWWQVEEDVYGTVKDLKDNPVYYLEITENRLTFYTISLNENEGYGFSDKYYVLDGAYCYYDYDEITKDNYKQAIDAVYGGRFIVTFDDEDRLVLTDYYNDENKDDGFTISTYVKIPATEWPIEE